MKKVVFYTYIKNIVLGKGIVFEARKQRQKRREQIIKIKYNAYCDFRYKYVV